MSKEVSVAPKERINIKFKPGTGNNKEEVELPLKMLMLGDYTGRPDERPVEQRELIDVNKDNFNDVLKGHQIGLDLKVPNRLDDSPEASDMTVQLKIENMRDFEPEQIAKQVPELKSLLDLREALVALKGPLGNVPAFRKAIQGLLEDEGARKKLLEELTGPQG